MELSYPLLNGRNRNNKRRKGGNGYAGSNDFGISYGARQGKADPSIVPPA